MSPFWTVCGKRSSGSEEDRWKEDIPQRLKFTDANVSGCGIRRPGKME